VNGRLLANPRESPAVALYKPLIVSDPGPYDFGSLLDSRRFFRRAEFRCNCGIGLLRDNHEPHISAVLISDFSRAFSGFHALGFVECDPATRRRKPLDQQPGNHLGLRKRWIRARQATAADVEAKRYDRIGHNLWFRSEKHP
jgi:hypothetical protein